MIKITDVITRRIVQALIGVLVCVSPVFAEVEVRVSIKDHHFVPAEIKVKPNEKVKLIVTNEDPTAEEFESFSLNREKMIRPGQSVTIYLSPLKPGRYEFFGEFHPDSAKGRIIAEE